jgi:hypothetical protein
MASDYRAGFVSNDRIHKAKLPDAIGNLAKLLF